MPNPAAANLIAEHLPTGLPHPGTAEHKPFTIPLPGLRNTGIPQEMAKHFAAQAGFPTHDTPKIIGEAIVHLLETKGGLALIPHAEFEQLREQAALVAGITPKVVEVYGRGQHVLTIAVTGARVTLTELQLQALRGGT